MQAREALIRKARQRVKMRPSELARRLGVPHARIAHLESGIRRPELQVIDRLNVFEEIAKALGVPARELLPTKLLAQMKRIVEGRP